MTPFPVGCYRKMAPSKVQCCEVIKLHYQSKSLKIDAKGIRKYHPKLGTFDTNKVQRIVEESGSIEDIRHANTEQILDIIFSQNGITSNTCYRLEVDAIFTYTGSYSVLYIK